MGKLLSVQNGVHTEYTLIGYRIAHIMILDVQITAILLLGSLTTELLISIQYLNNLIMNTILSGAIYVAVVLISGNIPIIFLMDVTNVLDVDTLPQLLLTLTN